MEIYYDNLKQAADSLRTITNKPVTTTEPSTTYTVILKFRRLDIPNTHPYWSGVKKPRDAAMDKTAIWWFSKGTTKIVVLKEVGLPSAGEMVWVKRIKTYTIIRWIVWWLQTRRCSPIWGIWSAWKNTMQSSHIGDYSIRIVNQKMLQNHNYRYQAAKIRHYANLYGKTRNVKPDEYAVSTYINVAGTCGSNHTGVRHWLQ